jgi:beta-1,4-mannosyl-glycoprotein beta-1,4-N-acetylglucosaminyltransferase
MRIFDTFPFDGELDLLEHRLAETYELVDVFVLVEAAQTYSGAPKELTFAAHRERFAWASAKLRHITLKSLGDGTPRHRAAVQRDAVRLGLRDAAPNDVILLFDVDEIANPALLRQLREHGIDQPRRVLMTRHYQHADAVAPRSPCCPTPGLAFPSATPYLHPGNWDALDAGWRSASGVAVPFSALASRNAFDLRFGDVDAPPLPDGGRHFSSVDPSTQLERKLHRVFHTEWAGSRETSPVHLARARAHGVHHRGWWYAERPSGPVPDDVARLVARIGTAPPFPPLRRRRLVRTWSWLRLQKWIPDRVVAAIDRRFERLIPLLVLPLLLADGIRYAAASMSTKPRSDMSRTNSAASRSHVERSTA